jgi:hypothetical protein
MPSNMPFTWGHCKQVWTDGKTHEISTREVPHKSTKRKGRHRKELRPPVCECKPGKPCNLSADEQSVLSLLVLRGADSAKERVLLRRLICGNGPCNSWNARVDVAEILALVSARAELKTLADIEPDEINI